MLVMEKQVKLHLGCFHKKIHGFINIDIRDDVNPDVIDDVFKLDKFEDNSVDLIYTSHVLEHTTFDDAKKALKVWFNKLKPGGIVRISVPDVEKSFAHYFLHKDLDKVRNLIWGSQKHPYDYHMAGWDEATLKRDLESVGFNFIGRYNWKDTEHFYVDDYSQAYLPHLDKINGVLMSLNVEAIKPTNKVNK